MCDPAHELGRTAPKHRSRVFLSNLFCPSERHVTAKSVWRHSASSRSLTDGAPCALSQLHAPPASFGAAALHCTQWSLCTITSAYQLLIDVPRTGGACGDDGDARPARRRGFLARRICWRAMGRRLRSRTASGWARNACTMVLHHSHLHVRGTCFGISERQSVLQGGGNGDAALARRSSSHRRNAPGANDVLYPKPRATAPLLQVSFVFGMALNLCRAAGGLLLP